MKQLTGAWNWIQKQFKVHTTRSLLISIPAAALITAGVLWACGILSLESWSYLPNREYILAPTEPAEPQTLNELLHSDMPSMDTLLQNPSIAQELLNAKTLTDVVDSRLALNNLHDLDVQLAAQLAEDPETIDVVDMESAQINAVSASHSEKAVITSLVYTPGDHSAEQLATTNALQNQYQTMATLKAATGQLLAPKEYDDLVVMPIAMNMKGIVDDGEAMIHLLPAGDWLPTDGYKLYREVDGQSVLIAENVASPSAALAGGVGGEHALKVQALYKQAELSDAKLSQLGMTASQFRETAYRMDTAESKTRISGQNNFMRMHELLITEPNGNEQKIPETDLMLGSPVVVMGRQANGLYQSAAVQSRIWKQFSLIPSALPSGIDSIQTLPNGQAKYRLAAEIMAARQQISTLSFVDDAFAEEAGFLIRDDLSTLGLDDGTTVTYRVETPDHQTSTLEIAYGYTNTLTKPQGLMGYGIDGKVPLRWNAAENPQERGIISGYMIERKLDGESKFTVVNGEPVAITYILNENDIYFETLSFYEDAVENGRTAEYRIRSLDIFGRMSKPSDVIKFKVEQVTPPNAPTVSAPVFSRDGSSASIGEMIAVQNAINQNKGKTGIVLPVFTDSADTVRFTIYRAEAVGARPFGKPVPIANLSYDNPKPKAEATASSEPLTEPVPQEQAQTGIKRVNGTQQTLLQNAAASYPDLVYYDADIKEGVTYKYWVSVWDSWNNESAWSQSVSYGVRTGAEPATPAALNAAMLVRELPDRSNDPPGLVNDSTVTLANLAQMPTMPVRKIPGTDADTVKRADESGIAIGHFMSVAGMPDVIDKQFDNLPEQKYIHMLVAVRGEDVQPNGGAWLQWPAYSGEGLGGYAVYRPVFPVGALPDLQQMSRSELIQLGTWKKTTSNTVTQNQLFVTGLDKTPGKIHLFLICLLPETEGTTASIETDGKKETIFVPEGLQHAQAPIYSPHQIIFAEDLYSYRDYYHEIEGLELTWEAAAGNPEYAVFMIEVPRELPSLSIDKYKQMSVEELWNLGGWKRMLTTSKTNAVISETSYSHLVDTMPIIAVCVQTGSKNITDITREQSVDLSIDLLTSKTAQEIHAGFVSLDWDIPDDPQVQFYRVYRAEVNSFKTPVDESALAWTLVGDRLSSPQYTDPVEQSRAHFYYYKVTSVSPWGVEAAAGTVKPFRVPATKPPQTPNLLTPLQSKDGIKVNFAAVPYCDKYVIYRTAITNVSDEYLTRLNSNVKTALFSSPSLEDEFLTSLLGSSIKLSGKPGLQTPLNAASRFKTLHYGDASRVSGLDTGTKLSTYQQILNDLGPLALADYRDLSIEMMKRVTWENIGELRVDYETGAVLDPNTGNPVDPVDPATGLLKPLYFIDPTPQYGIMYLYTVQAWNDDGLGSTRPEPIEATPRRSGPFDPIKNLKGEWVNKQPLLTWNTPRMSTLTPERCLEETVGYIVYRSDTKNGEYYQASPMVFAPTWTDKNADPYAYNWYRIKVLDTGGYLSEFSDPILMQMNFVSTVKPKIPHFSLDPLQAPTIAFERNRYTVALRIPFEASYTLTGTEPIEVTVTAVDANGSPVTGFTVDATAKKVLAGPALGVGTYSVTVQAENAAGTDQKDFVLTVGEPEARTPPKLATRDDQYTFVFSRPARPTGTFEEQLAATGSIPLTWSLEPYVEATGMPSTVPETVSIDQNGLLSIEQQTAAGSYFFYVVVSNAMGSDKQLIHMEIANASALSQTFRPRGVSVSSGRSEGTMPLVQLVVSEQKPADKGGYYSDSADCAGFTLADVSLIPSSASAPHSPGYVGTATLNLEGVEPIPVHIYGATMQTTSDGEVMTVGTVYLDQPVVLKATGVTLVSMDINPKNEKQTVSGYVKSTKPNQNVMGSTYAVAFTDAVLSPQGTVNAAVTIPTLKYEQFVLHNIDNVQIRLPSTASDTFFLMASCKQVTMKAPLETLSNEGITFGAGSYGFDLDGKISGTMVAVEQEQFLQLLVPGGSGLRVKAKLTFTHGVAQSDSYIRGRLILPFERADAVGSGVPGVYAGVHPKTSLMDALADVNLGDVQRVKDHLAQGDLSILDSLILKFGQNVQENALLIVPGDKALQDECGYVDFNVKNWSGKGFMVESAAMTPTRMAERAMSINLQRSQAIVIAPTSVSIDLDREKFHPVAGGGENPLIQTPKETEKPFWVGLVMKGGTVALPPDFVETAEGGSILFGLAEGEMIYDLNGFSYQNYLYSDDKDGVPAQFGDSLGGFEDVRVFDCLLDMYANRVNLEINAKVRLDLFNNNWVNARLYTNKENNDDGQKGSFLCSVAPTVIEGANGAGVDLNIDGGFLKPDGLHINGNIMVDTPEVQTDSEEPLAFIDMIVPSKAEMTNRENNRENIWANVTLDKPTPITFQGFSMEIRALDLEYSEAKTIEQKKAAGTVIALPQSGYPTYLSLHGSTVLSENIAMGQDTTDTVKLECRKSDIVPVVLYEECASVLDANFDDCISVKGKLVPKLTGSDLTVPGGASNMSANTKDTAPHIMLLSAGTAPAVPALPQIPALPNAESILKDAKATAEEKLAAYKKALKDEIDQYKKAVEAELAKYKDMTEAEAKKYREAAEKQLEEYKGKAVDELEKYLDITQEELKQYKEELEKELGEYIDLGKLGAGLIEFNTEQLDLNYLSQLKSLPVVTKTRFGYDMDNERCYFAVGLMPKNKPGSNKETIAINFGAGDIRNFTGIVTYNMVVKRDAQGRHEFPAQPGEIAAFIKNMSVYRESGSTFAAGIRGTMKIIGFCEIRELYFGFEKGPIINADGGIYIPLDVAGMISGDGMEKVGTVAILYDHPNRYFSFSMTLDGIDLVAAKVSGSMGFEFSPHMFGVSLGYPETMAGNISIFRFGVGIGFRIDSEEGNYIRAKLEVGLQKDVKVAIVYLSGYLYAGADGGYYWGGTDKGNGFYLTIYLKGGIKGGIMLGEARWDIIKLMLDARGTISSLPPSKDWNLHCSAKVSYCLDLFLFSIDGSVEASFDTTIAAPQIV